MIWKLIWTYIKIIIVIILLVALSYLIIKIVSKEYNSEEYETIKTNMLLIQGKTEVIANKVDIKEKNAKYIGTALKEREDDKKIQKLIQSNIIDIDSKKSKYYCLDNNDLNELGLDSIKTDNFFIVDYKKNEVIYIDGIRDNEGNMVYKLSDMK